MLRDVRGTSYGPDRQATDEVLRAWVTAVARRDNSTCLQLDDSSTKLLKSATMVNVQYPAKYASDRLRLSFVVGPPGGRLEVASVETDGTKTREQLRRIKAGDVLLKMNGADVVSAADVAAQSGVIWAGGGSATVTLVLEAAERRTVDLFPSVKSSSPVLGLYDNMARRTLDSAESRKAFLKKAESSYAGLNSAPGHTAEFETLLQRTFENLSNIDDKQVYPDADVRQYLAEVVGEYRKIEELDEDAFLDEWMACEGIDMDLALIAGELPSDVPAARDLNFASGVAPRVVKRWLEVYGGGGGGSNTL